MTDDYCWLVPRLLLISHEHRCQIKRPLQFACPRALHFRSSRSLLITLATIKRRLGTSQIPNNLCIKMRRCRMSVGQWFMTVAIVHHKDCCWPRYCMNGWISMLRPKKRLWVGVRVTWGFCRYFNWGKVIWKSGCVYKERLIFCHF